MFCFAFAVIYVGILEKVTWFCRKKVKKNVPLLDGSTFRYNIKA